MISTIIPATAHINTSGTVMPGTLSVSEPGILVTLTLFVLLTAKELADSASENHATQDVFVGRILNIGIIPLAMAFFNIILMETIKLI